MHSFVPRGHGGLIAVALALTLAGCAAPKTIYGWGDYQGQVYQHFKGQGNGPEQQIIDLEKGLQEMAAKGKTPPPGYYGHLGLMYLTAGKNEQAAQSWDKEKSLFPESTKYMDFLLANMKKQGG